MNYNVSVVVCCYNPSYSKLMATLKSIIQQKNITFQIIVCDDGSDEDFFDKIDAFFKNVSFTDFKLVKNNKNIGTVCNFLSGVSASDGLYIKGISPGDLLYDEQVLYNLYSFGILNDYSVIFSDVLYYSSNPLRIVFDKKLLPKNLSNYKKGQSKQFIQYLCYDDVPLGASYFFKKSVLNNYLWLIKDNIVYAEDYAVGLMISNGISIFYYDNVTIWYECDSGISTRKNENWNALLNKDLESMHQLVLDNKKNIKNKYLVFLYTVFLKTRKIKSKFLRTFLRTIVYPPYFFAFFKKNRFVKDKMNEDLYRYLKRYFSDISF